MRAPWPGCIQEGVHSSPSRFHTETLLCTPTPILHSSLNVTLLQCPFTVFYMLNLHPASRLFRFTARIRIFFFSHSTLVELFLVYFFLIFRFDTVWGLNSLNIAHISCMGCFLFAFTTDPRFRVSLSDNKDGISLRLFQPFLGLSNVSKLHKQFVVNVLFAKQSVTPWYPFYVTQQSHFFSKMTALVFVLQLLN